MSDKHYIFTSESVAEGHPDKLCDRVSDALLDLYMTTDADSRTAIECLATTDFLCIAGETRGPASITPADIEQTARKAVKDIGYDQAEFHWDKIKIDNRLHKQSVDIAVGVDASSDKDEGAGDQGMMFGYACRETDSLMPAPICYAHDILHRLADDRKSGALSMLGPDAKAQVSMAYDNGKPVSVESVLVSTQHAEALSQDDIREIVRPYVKLALPQGMMCAEDKFYVNPTGRFVIGGPHGDCGLTGRKIIVDTYGGAAPHGGGAFSGKDPSKVDRSAAYAARYVAKNIVAAGLADRCTLQLSYAIGLPQPISLMVNTHGTGRYKDDALAGVIRDVVDLSPRGIRTKLDLNRPIYERTAAYGHFGRKAETDGGFSWEKTDLVDDLLSAVQSSKYKAAEIRDPQFATA
ncbi:MAG: methionine adenosyltransferase [Pseudomonadota bacterium]